MWNEGGSPCRLLPFARSLTFFLGFTSLAGGYLVGLGHCPGHDLGRRSKRLGKPSDGCSAFGTQWHVPVAQGTDASGGPRDVFDPEPSTETLVVETEFGHPC